MASADDYAKWIVANADKKGTPQFDTVAKAYQQAKQESDAATSTAKSSSPAMDMLLRAVSSPGAGAETALHVASGLPNLVSRAFGGPDIQYQPRGLAGQEMSAAADYPGQVYGKAVEQQMLERAKGAPSVNISGQNMVPSVGGMLYEQPAETPAQSRAMAAGGALALNVLPMLAGGLARAGPAELPVLNKPSGLMDVLAGNVDKIRGNYVRSISGNPATRASLAESLTNPVSPVPHYPMNAAEAVSGQWEGTPIQALQRQVSSSPVQLPNDGPAISQAFNRQAAQQAGAMNALKELRDNVTAGMRDRAMAGASGGVSPTLPAAAADEMLATPGVGASTLVKSVVEKARTKLENLTRPDGTIDPQDLYTVRKELGNDIEVASKENANWDKSLSGKLQGDLQKSFDDAIENAGGQGWKAYLNTYSRLSQKAQRALDTQEGQYKPEQMTNLAGPDAATAGAATHVPHVLTRSGTLANWLLNGVRRGVQDRVTSSIGDATLNPRNGVLAADLMKGIRPEDFLAANAKRQALARALATGTIGGMMGDQNGP